MLLKLKDDSQNAQIENTTTVLIGLMMHGLTNLMTNELRQFEAMYLIDIKEVTCSLFLKDSMQRCSYITFNKGLDKFVDAKV